MSNRYDIDPEFIVNGSPFSLSSINDAPTITNPTFTINDVTTYAPADVSMQNWGAPDTGVIRFQIWDGVGAPAIATVGSTIYLTGTSQNGLNIDNINVVIDSVDDFGMYVQVMLHAASAGDNAAVDAYLLGLTGNLSTVVMNKASSKTITSENIGHLDAPTITDPSFKINVEISTPTAQGNRDSAFPTSTYPNGIGVYYYANSMAPISAGDTISWSGIDAALAEYNSQWSYNLNGVNFTVISHTQIEGTQYLLWLDGASSSYDASLWNSTSPFWYYETGIPASIVSQAISNITPTELSYLSGVSSSISNALWSSVVVDGTNNGLTLSKNTKYFVNTLTNRTVTLPSAPSLGDEIMIFDASNYAGSYPVTVNNGGSLINASNDSASLDSNGFAASFVYTGSGLGWRMG